MEKSFVYVLQRNWWDDGRVYAVTPDLDTMRALLKSDEVEGEEKLYRDGNTWHNKNWIVSRVDYYDN